MSADVLVSWKCRVLQYQKQVLQDQILQDPLVHDQSAQNQIAQNQIAQSQTAQNQTAQNQAVQGLLFSLESETDRNAQDPLRLDPFSLTAQNIEFWRSPADEPGLAALYFVIDQELPLLLYVGETCKANQRWKGVHDCKRYVRNYVEAHRIHHLPVSVSIGFWPHAPEQTRARQRMERSLIEQWRSPFNKENWKHWGTPFVWGKSS